MTIAIDIRVLGPGVKRVIDPHNVVDIFIAVKNILEDNA